MPENSPLHVVIDFLFAWVDLIDRFLALVSIRPIIVLGKSFILLALLSILVVLFMLGKDLTP